MAVDWPGHEQRFQRELTLAAGECSARTSECGFCLCSSNLRRAWVQQAVKVDLTINLKTAKALGLTVPLPMIGRVDEVIE
jgi:hypothetical protein